MRNLVHAMALLSSAVVMAVVVGCGDSSTTSSSGLRGGTNNITEVSWLLNESPGEATPVGEAKKTVKEGDAVRVVGRIGGRVKPMEVGSPVFLIVDKSVPHCGELPDDHCPTPWDYCCEPPDNLLANSATIQLVSADGGMYQGDPISAGLKPLDEVVIVGTVGPRPSDKVLTIRATGVYRQKAADLATPSTEADHGHDHGS